MKIKEVYKLKRFGTYWVEVDTDDLEKIKRVVKALKKAVKGRFIKFIVVPKDIINLVKTTCGK